ncbi:MFS transporter [Streptomyces sp. 7R007]
MRAHRGLTLASSVAGAVIVALDGTVLTVAQPTLREDLDASFAQVQWTSTGYLIAVAGLLVIAGRLGDRYGHHRLFAVGMLGFGAASAGIGLAPDVGWVIGLRVVQGVFGALAQPATLGMLRAVFPPDGLRMPIAVRTSAIGLAAAAGPVLGGALVAGPGWRAAFFLNVVPATVFGLLALAVRTPRRSSPIRLDLPGALLLAVTLACLVHALVARSAAEAAVAALAGALLVRHERCAASPLIPPDALGPALGVLVAASAALNGTLFTATFLLQDAFGLDPLQMALRSLPLAAAMILAAPGCAVLLRRAGARRTTVSAMLVLVAGILLLDRASGTFSLCAAFALLGAGFGTVMVAATHVVVRRAAVGSAGVAGGLQQTAMNVGPVLGVSAATVLTELGGGQRPALLVLAAPAAVGAVAAAALPGRRCDAGDDHRQPGDRVGVPARR